MPTEASALGLKPAPPGAEAFWILPPLLVIGGAFFYPLVLIVRQATAVQAGEVPFQPFRDLIGSGLFRHAVLNTLEIAAASTLGCVVLGFTLALVLSFVRFPGARVVARLIDCVIALPTFLVTLAFTFIYGSAGLLNGALMQGFGLSLPPIAFLYSAWGVILAEVTVFAPFVIRPLMAAFSLIDPAQIEVASGLGARPMRIVRRIILPAAAPALLASGSLCLLLTVNEFGIVLFIGAKGVITLPLLIYDKAIQESDYTAACAIAIVNIVLSLVLFGLYRFIVTRVGGRRAGLV